MALARLDVDWQSIVVPHDVTVLLRESSRRIEAFSQDRDRGPIPGFVPSDFVTVYRVLRAVVEADLAPGNLFCEWGSGLGVVSCLACMLGMDATGIEIEAELVEESRALAEEFELPVEFLHGSFIPTGGEELAEATDGIAWLDTSSSAAHDPAELEPEDFDVIFAYPWPGEERVVAKLFNRFAAHGALLVTYHGLEDPQVRRKVKKRR